MASTEENNFHRFAAAPKSEGQISRGGIRSHGMNRGLLDLDLNVVPPDDGGYESPAQIESRFSGGEIAVAGSGKGVNMRYWDALLEASNRALRDYEESGRGEEEKARNRRRDAETGGGGELRKGAGRIRKRVNTSNGHSLAEIHAASAPVVVARSTRGRAVAMPSKFKDSVFYHATAVVAEEARSSRRRYR